jgi:glycosyltransferase involved in cell wall biosynthesis|tara:strand:+ start:209 stop:916 length:708 start_codon:yes stop_codon:yes gene_type:complete
MPKLSIIIPCYNEVGNIPDLVNKLEAVRNKETEIILVDNGSTDETGAVLARELIKKQQLYKTVSINRNIGYGHGIKTGIREAKGDVIAWTHADLQTDPLDVIKAYSIYMGITNNEKCILKGKRIGRNLFDAFFTFGMGILSSFLMGVKLNDINAQPKMFHRSFLDKMVYAPDDFSFDLYFLYQASVNRYEILEYPVHFGKRLHGESKGGGTLGGKWKLIKRTWAYMNKLKKELKN